MANAFLASAFNNAVLYISFTFKMFCYLLELLEPEMLKCLSCIFFMMKLIFKRNLMKLVIKEWGFFFFSTYSLCGTFEEASEYFNILVLKNSLLFFSVAENMHLTLVLGLLRAIRTKKPHPYLTVLSFLRKKDNASCLKLHHLKLDKLKL